MAVLDRRIALLAEPNRVFAKRARRSNFEDWMARRAQDDAVAGLKGSVALEAEHPNTEIGSIRLLFVARDVAPTDAAVLGGVSKVEWTIARKPGLRTAMIEFGRPVAGAFRSGLKGSWFNRRKTETSDIKR